MGRRWIGGLGFIVSIRGDRYILLDNHYIFIIYYYRYFFCCHSYVFYYLCLTFIRIYPVMYIRSLVFIDSSFSNYSYRFFHLVDLADPRDISRKKLEIITYRLSL